MREFLNDILESLGMQWIAENGRDSRRMGFLLLALLGFFALAGTAAFIGHRCGWW